ncbi:MAG: SDR family NAD(P)-dependent oxidoreductase [Gammaproteobacteria bacterium]
MPSGKVVIVTGGARGIGRAIALHIGGLGARVIVADLGGAVDRLGAPAPEPAEAVAQAIRAAGGSADACAENIATMHGAQRAVDLALQRHGRLDGLVCAAGLYVHKTILNTTEQEWDDVIASHLKGHFACTQAALRAMLPQGSGSIVHFSSAAAVAPPAMCAAYAAAKAGVLGLMRSTASEVAARGIRVNCVLPGASTRMTDLIYERMGVATRELKPPGDQSPVGEHRLSAGVGLRSELAAGTWRDPMNVAPFVAFLLSERSAHVTGKSFAVVGDQVTHVHERSYGRTIRSGGTWSAQTLQQRFDSELAPELAVQPEFPWPPP